MGSPARTEWPLILAYHHISHATTSRYVMTEQAFERQLDGLLRAGYQAVPLSQAITSGASGTGDAPSRTFTITFDDGLASFAERALPVLDRLGLIGATALFVPTEYVGRSNEWREEPSLLDRLRRRTDASERLLGWDEIAEAASLGVTIGSHGAGHLPMHTMSAEDALAEARASRQALIERGLEADYFAYPFGWLNDITKHAVRDAGFLAALSVTHGGTDRYDIVRVPIYGTDVWPVSALKTSGRFFATYEAARALMGKGGSA